MECSEPGAIRDEELMAYLAGEVVRPAVQQHLAVCQCCSAQLTEYRAVERLLVNKLYRWDCPPSQVLGDYHLGLLTDEHARQISQHMKLCVLCTQEVAILNEFLAQDALTDKHVVVSPSSLNSYHPVQETKQTLDGLYDRVRTGARRIMATLLPPQPRLAHQRDAMLHSTLWPRLYSAEDLSVSIQVVRGPSRNGALQLIGFVTRSGVALEALQGTPIQLLSQAGNMYTETIDDLGNFVFSSVIPAIYTLEMQFPEQTIVIDQITITEHE